jgi:mRNA interferase HigB
MERAKEPLQQWFRVANARGLVWRNWADLRETYPKADKVGDCVVFDIGGNKFRLLARIEYGKGDRSGRVFVVKIMDHKEYDRKLWHKECGCYKANLIKRSPVKEPHIASNRSPEALRRRARVRAELQSKAEIRGTGR